MSFVSCYKLGQTEWFFAGVSPQLQHAQLRTTKYSAQPPCLPWLPPPPPPPSHHRFTHTHKHTYKHTYQQTYIHTSAMLVTPPWCIINSKDFLWTEHRERYARVKLKTRQLTTRQIMASVWRLTLSVSQSPSSLSHSQFYLHIFALQWEFASWTTLGFGPREARLFWAVVVWGCPPAKQDMSPITHELVH